MKFISTGSTLLLLSISTTISASLADAHHHSSRALDHDKRQFGRFGQYQLHSVISSPLLYRLLTMTLRAQQVAVEVVEGAEEEEMAALLVRGMLRRVSDLFLPLSRRRITDAELLFSSRQRCCCSSRSINCNRKQSVPLSSRFLHPRSCSYSPAISQRLSDVIKEEMRLEKTMLMRLRFSTRCRSSEFPHSRSQSSSTWTHSRRTASSCRESSRFRYFWQQLHQFLFDPN